MTFTSLRDHMLAATMHDRWETISEIVTALRKSYGLRFTRIDVIAGLQQLRSDGSHSLVSRLRKYSEQPLKEYRLYVKESAVGLRGVNR